VGSSLLDHANKVLALSSQFTELAQAISSGAGASLRIGIAGSTMHSGLVDILVKFNELEPDVDVAITQQPIRGLLHSLRTYESDLVFVRTDVRVPGFETTVLGEEALWAAVPRGHALDQTGAVALRDLADEPFIGFVGPFGRVVRDYISEACLMGDFIPAIETRTDDVQSLLGLVASGVGVSLVPEGVARSVEMGGIRYRRIAPPVPKTTYCVLSRTTGWSASPAQRFLELAQTMSAYTAGSEHHGAS
jgi:DNA-binding transcriptional LysR family regulator